LEVDGSYHALGAFFDKLSKFSRIVNVSDVKIVESRKTGQTISTTCVATTFVYNEEKDNAEIQKALTAKKK
jgi:type IV pilus assembly protein PilO